MISDSRPIRRLLGLAAAFAVVMPLALIAYAEDQSNDTYPAVFCGTGDTGESAWHWVHNQIPDGVVSATLTASFEVLTGPNAGSVIDVVIPGVIGSVIHYEFYYDYGLRLLPTPSDDVDGGNLLLSHWPTCGTSTTESTISSTSTTIAGSSTTIEESTTTTVAGVTLTTSLEESTTTLIEATTLTSESSTSTTFSVSTSPSQTTPSTFADEVKGTEVLPFTGQGMAGMAGLALVLAAIGALVLTATGQRGEIDEW